jgi:hypothetical protein
VQLLQEVKTEEAVQFFTLLQGKIDVQDALKKKHWPAAAISMLPQQKKPGASASIYAGFSYFKSKMTGPTHTSPKAAAPQQEQSSGSSPAQSSTAKPSFPCCFYTVLTLIAVACLFGYLSKNEERKDKNDLLQREIREREETRQEYYKEGNYNYQSHNYQSQTYRDYRNAENAAIYCMIAAFCALGLILTRCCCCTLPKWLCSRLCSRILHAL